MARVTYQELYKHTNELISASSAIGDLGTEPRGLIYPSLTSFFSVFIVDKSSPQLANRISLLAYEAVLPGSSFQLGSVFGDRQGVTEQYPTKKIFPAVDVSFYVNYDYKTIDYFENWMKLISPPFDSEESPLMGYKFNYPNFYEREIIITKFEREFFEPNERLKPSPNPREPKKSIKYHLINAFPTNIISLPVSYSPSDVLRTTITFNYDRYLSLIHI